MPAVSRQVCSLNARPKRSTVRPVPIREPGFATCGLGPQNEDPMTISEALVTAVRALRSQVVDAPDRTARVLLADVLACDQAWLAAHDDEHLAEASFRKFEEMVRRRCMGVPLQYIRGFQEFYGRKFSVSSDVLIPRPETEHLVEAALERIPPGGLAVDVGTGSGAIAVSVALERPDLQVVGSDISIRALHVARKNASRLGARVEFSSGDGTGAFTSGIFDAVLSNPPYVPLRDAGSLQRELRHEPAIALFGGEHGLQLIERLVREVPRVLKPGGWLMIEIGYNARSSVDRMLGNDPAWESVQFLPDLAGIDRIVTARRSRTSVAMNVAGCRPSRLGPPLPPPGDVAR